MELRTYLRILGRRWWIVLLVTVMSTGVTLYLVLPQPSYYVAGTTFVVRPRAIEGESNVRAWDTLIRGPEINSTFAAVARSGHVRSRALERLGLPASGSGVSVEADVAAGTNVVAITVTGGDPQLVRDVAVAVGAETVTFVSQLGDAFELVPLDPPAVPSQPAGPEKRVTIVLGAILGLVVGSALVFLVHYLRSPVVPSGGQSGESPAAQRRASLLVSHGPYGSGR